MAAEEKDRLAREKKDLQERIADREKQLATSQKLATEKEQMKKMLQEEIRKLKTAK